MSALLFLAALAAAALAVHKAVKHTERQSFTLGGPVRRLEVHLPAGRVRVVASSGPDVRVERTLRFAGTRPVLREQRDGETVRLGLASGRGFAGYVDYRLEVPAHVWVEARVEAGTIEVEGLHGELEARVNAGRIAVRRLAGPARLEVGAGQVHARELASPRLEARCDLGTLDLAFAAPPERVDARASAGSVALRLPPEPYHVRAKAELGQCHVRVPQDSGATRVVDVRSGLGEVSVLPAEGGRAWAPIPAPVALSQPAPVGEPVAAAVPVAPPPGASPRAGTEPDPRLARVDALCDRVLATLREGPGLLREVVQRPEATVEALRRGCHALVRREAELRALWTPEDARRLAAEREALEARVAAERDAVTRERLAAALAALDAQREQRAELATAASRLEAEHVRLYYTLEGLHAQLLRVRSADVGSVGAVDAGLRRSLERLGTEVDAVAEALESVQHEGTGHVSPVEEGSGAPSRGTRQRV